MNLATLLTVLIGFGLLSALVALVRSWRAGSVRETAEPSWADGLPADFGPRVTSRRLRYFRWALLLLMLLALVFHFYWAFLAAGPFRIERSYAGLKDRRDQRQRFFEDSAL